MKHLFTLICVFGFCNQTLAMPDEGFPIYDAHMHYDQDMWQSLPPATAIRLIKEQGIIQAMVSSTPGHGVEKLYVLDNKTIVPMLRPYKSWRHRYLWFKDPGLKIYLQQQFEKVPYRGIGEFHVFGNDVKHRPVYEMIEFARENNLLLHAHTDLLGMQLLLEKSSDLKVIWAHGGFDVPIEELEKLIHLHDQFYIELSFREGMLDEDGMLVKEWEQFLIQYPNRFLIGSDTYKPSRWADLPEIVNTMTNWIKQLPPKVQSDISRNNFKELFN